MEPKRTKRTRQQTATLLTAISAIVKRDEETLTILDPNDPNRAMMEKDLAYNRRLLTITTDQFGTATSIKVKPQGSRLIRAGCPSCGYTIRVSMMWIICALPKCPNPNCERKGKTFEVDEQFKNQMLQTFEPMQESKPEPVIDATAKDVDFQRMRKESEGFFTGPVKGIPHVAIKLKEKKHG